MSDRFELPAELNIYGALETRDALLGWCAAQSAKGADHLEVSAREPQQWQGKLRHAGAIFLGAFAAVWFWKSRYAIAVVLIVSAMAGWAMFTQ